MSPELHHRVKLVFEHVVGRPLEQREAVLASRCGGDAAVERRVRELLAAHDAADERGPTICPDLRPGPSGPPEYEAGALVGPYRLVRVLGDGGFGVVWEAERRQPMIQRVAVKILKPGMDSVAVLARFEQERQTLAIMQHPNVARVLDAGTTARGHPYVAMELVDGHPITEFCDERSLAVRQRLELFHRMCAGVQHAHLKGVIHRDLKPANILVAAVDGEPIPKIIDFGIAKAIGGRAADTPAMTAPDTRVGTPAYMSPEQLEKGGADVDTRVDVYALGVVLCELLTGTTPRGATPWPEAVRGPTTPSALLRADPARLAETAALRGTDPNRLLAQVRGELDWIAARALEPERERRYASVAELAADVRRHLDGLGVFAAPPTLGYRARKFVRRHRGPVMAAAAVVAALVAGLAATAWQAARAHRNATNAIQAQLRVQTINQFMVDALGSADPGEVTGRMDTTVADAMLGIAARLDGGSLRDDPASEADLRRTISTVLRSHGRLAEAESQQRVALLIFQGLHPDGDHQDVADALSDLAVVMRELGRIDEAAALQERALAVQERVSTAKPLQIASMRCRLAVMRGDQGRLEEAESLMRRGLAAYEQIGATGGTDDYAKQLNNFAYLLSRQGNLEEADQLFEKALGLQRRAHAGRDHPELAEALQNLGVNRAQLGRAAEAEAMLAEALEMGRRIYGERDHPSVAAALMNLAGVRLGLGRAAETDSLLEQALQMYRRLHHATDHHDVAAALSALGGRRFWQGRPADAEPLLDEAVSVFRRTVPAEGSPELVEALFGHAQCLRDLGRFAEAADQASRAVDMATALFPDGDPLRARSLAVLASVYHRQGREQEARSLVAEASQMVLRLQPPDSVDASRIAAIHREILGE